MNRKQFLKKCTCTLCSCAAVGTFVPDVSAEEAKPNEDWRLGFVKKRYAKLIDILAGKLKDSELSEVLGELGSYCASTFSMVQQHKGDIDGYMEEFRKRTGDAITYDREKGVVTVTGAEHGDCFCPLVDRKLIKAKVCDCSLGWQRYAFEALLGKKVRVILKESVLRGGKRCSFEIHVA